MPEPPTTRRYEDPEVENLAEQVSRLSGFSREKLEELGGFSEEGH